MTIVMILSLRREYQEAVQDVDIICLSICFCIESSQNIGMAAERF